MSRTARTLAPTVGNPTLVTSLSRSTNTDVIGTTDEFAAVGGYAVAQGRFLTPADLQAGSQVAVVGQTVVNNLFSGVNPIGQKVVIDGQNFVVVGTLQAAASPTPTIRTIWSLSR